MILEEEVWNGLNEEWRERAMQWLERRRRNSDFSLT